MIENLINELNNLQEAKRLLDDILSHYSIYGKQFEKIDDTPYQQAGKLFTTSEANDLNNRIRNYINFDDSE